MMSANKIQINRANDAHTKRQVYFYNSDSVLPALYMMFIDEINKYDYDMMETASDGIDGKLCFNYFLGFPLCF